MSFHHWLPNVRSARAPARGQRHRLPGGSLRAALSGLHLEALEDRRLLAFLAPVDYPASSYSSELQAGDFNGDTILDLVTLDAYEGTVSVLLGNADGTFQPAQTSTVIPTPGYSDLYPQSVAVGDFNSDGRLDLAASTYDYYGRDRNDVLILLGNGDGTFAPAVPLRVWHGYECYLASGDLNADGNVDLVVTSSDVGGFGGTAMTVLLGDGDGNFAVGTTYRNKDFTPIGYLISPVLADVNSDGNADVVVADWYWVKVFLGNGDGTLQPPRNVDTTWGVYSVSVGDFNADGNLDLAAATYSRLSIFLGNGDGNFQAAQSLDAGVGSPTASDLNGDGVLDLVGLSGEGVSAFLGKGDGSFFLPTTTSIGSYPSSLVVADFNGDLRPDAAIGGEATIAVLLNDGNSSVPMVSVSDAAVTEGDTGTVDATFTLTLSYASEVDVTVHYDTADITAAALGDYAAAFGDLIIPAGQTSRTFAVAVNGDRLAEATETFAVNLSTATNATIGDGQGIGTILDDDPPPGIDISDASIVEGNSGTRSMNFTVSLSSASGQDVWVDYETANGTATTGNNDYLARSGTLHFAPGETTQTIAVTIKGDKKKESDETFLVNLSGAINGQISDDQGLGTILNDDSGGKVTGRKLFYNNSAWDGNGSAVSAADDAAIAPDKVALLPGETATFANVSGFDRGITGVMVDLIGAGDAAAITAGDFEFRVGNSSSSEAWSVLTAATTVVVRPGQGTGGDDRVMLAWQDRAIRNTWLQVTVLANERTGLDENDVFYFASVAGDTGQGGGAFGFAESADQLAIRQNPTLGFSMAALDNPLDINRSKKVDANDRLIIRQSPVIGFARVQPITMPAGNGSGGSGGASPGPSLSVGSASMAVDALFALSGNEHADRAANRWQLRDRVVERSLPDSLGFAGPLPLTPTGGEAEHVTRRWSPPPARRGAIDRSAAERVFHELVAAEGTDLLGH